MCQLRLQKRHRLSHKQLQFKGNSKKIYRGKGNVYLLRKRKKRIGRVLWGTKRSYQLEWIEWREDILCLDDFNNKIKSRKRSTFIL